MRTPILLTVTAEELDAIVAMARAMMVEPSEVLAQACMGLAHACGFHEGFVTDVRRPPYWGDAPGPRDAGHSLVVWFTPEEYGLALRLTEYLHVQEGDSLRCVSLPDVVLGAGLRFIADRQRQEAPGSPLWAIRLPVRYAQSGGQ